MVLEGKAKELFKKWYLKQDYCMASLQEYSSDLVLKMFWGMDISFQWGVYEDFFGKYGVFPEIVNTAIEEIDIKEPPYHSVVRTHEKWTACGFYGKKDDARNECIGVSNEKLNAKYV